MSGIQINGSNNTFMVADIGATNARFCLMREGDLDFKTLRIYKTTDFSSLEEVAKAYVLSQNVEPKAVCFGVAGPVEEGKDVRLTNCPWVFSQQSLEDALGTKVSLINDVEAVGYALPDIAEKNLTLIKDGNRDDKALMVVPGTGLGVCFVEPDGTVIASEAGTPFEREISGPGLARMYEGGVTPEEVLAKCRVGEAKAEEVMQAFFNKLAEFCCGLAQKEGAQSVYIGGFLPEMSDLVDKDKFSRHFEDEMAVFIFNFPYAGLLGSKNFLTLHKKHL